MRRSQRLAQKRGRDNSGTIHELPKTTAKKTRFDWSEWVAATDTKNYMMDDGFLDILAQKPASMIAQNPQYAGEIGNMIRLTTEPKGFVPSLLSAGNTFESRVITLITQQLGENNVRNIGGNHCPRSLERFEESVAAMQQGVPCIFQAILRNNSNKTYGVADILIRSDWINRLTDQNSLSDSETKKKAQLLKNPYPRRRTKTKRPQKTCAPYHYVVVDIKYKTMPLRSDGFRLRNDGNMKAYKSQLWIYNQALGEIQGYLPDYAFILGAKWKYTQAGQTHESDSCLERLGRIDYADLDSSYISATSRAVDWIQTVRREGHTWDMSKYPLPRDELYPNMCNTHDYPYHGIKKLFAEQHGDLSLLWHVGPKQRRIANNNGVYNWQDPKCTPEILGVNGPFRAKVLSRILEANHSDSHTIIPKHIQSGLYDWHHRELEFFVDFETTCSVFNPQDTLPNYGGVSVIFLIGVGYISPETKKWTYKQFLSDTLTVTEEIKICRQFTDWVQQIETRYGVKNIKKWHWSNAEPNFWNRACRRQPQRKRHRNISKKIARQLGLTEISGEQEWCDLLKIFLYEPIGIKGCLNYSLKTVAKTFYQYGFINTIWDDSSATANGADVAIEAYQADQECVKAGLPFSSHALAADIIKYNEVDCRVMQEILEYLRVNHSPLKNSIVKVVEPESDEDYSEN